MSLSKGIFLVFILSLNLFGFGQTKKELLVQLQQKNKAIDSLNAVISNWDNIVETRNRTIKFLREDKVELNNTIEGLHIKIRAKNTELSNLRKQARTGSAHLKLMNNKRPILKVPEGKYWIINQFVGDYITDLKEDSTGAFQGKEIHVFLKSINETMLTDPSKNLYGPQLYSSVESNKSLQFPIIFTENTTFSVLVMSGSFNEMISYEGNVYCSIIEKDN